MIFAMMMSKPKIARFQMDRIKWAMTLIELLVMYSIEYSIGYSIEYSIESE